jgi:hypothetical protein
MPNMFNQRALDALIQQSLREVPAGIEESAGPPSADRDITSLPSMPSTMGAPQPVRANGPEASPQRGASWWAHLMNMAGAGYNAYGQDQIRKYNEAEGGKSYIGWDKDKYFADPSKGIQIDAFDSPALPNSPLLGNNPSQGRVYGQALGTAALSSLVAAFLPKKIGNIGLAVNGIGNGAFGGVRQWAANSVNKNLQAKKSEYEALLPLKKPK